MVKIVDEQPFDYFENCGDYYLDIDISKARKIEMVSCFDSDNLPTGINKQDIAARSTAEMVHKKTKDKIINATNDFVEKLKEEK